MSAFQRSLALVVILGALVGFQPGTAGMGDPTGILTRDALFQALFEIRSYEEGCELLRAHPAIADFPFFAGCVDAVLQMIHLNVERATLLTRIFTDSVDTLATEDDRKNARAWYLVCQGSLARAEGAWEDAVRLKAEARDLFLASPPYLEGAAPAAAGLAGLYVDVGRLGAALDFYNLALTEYAALEAPIGQAKCHRDVGDVYVLLGRLADAESSYRQALSVLRGALAWANRAYVKQVEGEIQTALGHLYTVWERYDEALSANQAAGQACVESQNAVGLLQAVLQLGDIRMAQDQVSEATRQYEVAKAGAETVLREMPTASVVLSIEARSLQSIATARFAQGNYRDAEQGFEQALALVQQLRDRAAEADVRLKLGVLYLETARYEAAEEQALQALTLFESKGDKRGQFASSGLLAQIAGGKYECAAALDWQKHAEALLGDFAGECLAVQASFYTNLANLQMECGELRAAETNYSRALSLVERDNSATAVEVYVNASQFRLVCGLSEEAVLMSQSASQMASNLGMPRLVAAARQGEGDILLSLGRHAEAVLCLEDALEISKQADDPHGLTAAYHSLGVANQRMGRTADALRHFSSALVVAQARGILVREQAYAYQGIGATYAVLGDDRGLENYSKALALFEQVQDQRGIGLCLASIGAVRLEQHSFDSAKEYLAAALDLLEKGGLRAEQIYVQLNLGYLHWKCGDAESALASLTAALQRSVAAGTESLEVSVLLALGDVLSDMGDLDGALGRYRSAERKLLELGIPNETARVHARIGGILEQQGLPDEAVDSYRLAVDAIEQVRSNLETEELRSLWPRLGAQPYERLAILLSGEAPESALLFAERFKAKTLVDLMAYGLTDFRTSTPSPVLEREADLLREISFLEEELRREGERPVEQRRFDLVSELEERVAYKKGEYSAVIAQMKLDAPQYLTAKSLDSSELIAAHLAVRKRLDSGEAALVYFTTAEATLVWVITQGGIQTASQIAVSRRDLAARVASFRGTIQTPPSQAMLDMAPMEQGSALYDLLIAPVEEYLAGVEHLVIIPSDVLFYLPFGALYCCPGCQGRSLLGGQYLVEKYSLSYAPSLASLYWPLQHEGDGSYTSVLSVGNPTGDLLAAQTEATTVAALFPESTLLLREEGTEAAVKGALGVREYDVVHLSTHGLFDGTMPLLSEVVFREGEGEDGHLYAGEILGLPLSQTELVVMSACQTALPPEVSQDLVVGDEIQGLGQCLFVAGVPSALLTLWNVNDLSTSELVIQFYQNLMSGQAKGEALAEAQRALLKGDYGFSYRHPYYWAPFVMYGEWR